MTKSNFDLADVFRIGNRKCVVVSVILFVQILTKIEKKNENMFISRSSLLSTLDAQGLNPNPQSWVQYSSTFSFSRLSYFVP